MDILEEYRNSTFKKMFFNQQTKEQQIQIISSLNSSERRELLNLLPLYDVEELIKSVPKNSEESRLIYSSLSKDKLKEIYKNASEIEKEEIERAYAGLRAENLQSIQESEQELVDSSNSIIASHDRIEQANINIANSIQNISQHEQKIKETRIVLKKVTKERAKLIKKISKLSAKKNSRLGIFNKRRIEKLRQLTKNLQEVSTTLGELKQQNTSLRSEITREQQAIESERQAIIDAENNIEIQRQNIKLKEKEIKGKKVRIKQADKKRKQMLGRKLFKKTVNLSQDILVTRKKKKTSSYHINGPEISRLTSTEQEPSIEATIEPQHIGETIEIVPASEITSKEETIEMVPATEMPNLEEVEGAQVVGKQSREEETVQETISSPTVEPPQIEKDSQKEQLERSIQHLTNVLKTLVDSGLNILPNINLNSSNGNELLSQPIDSLTVGQLITIINVSNYAYQQGLKAKIEAEQERSIEENGNVIDFEEAKKRIRRKNTAFVSLPIIITIIILVALVLVGLTILTQK